MKHNLIWIDLEMTGLNPEIDHIIEIATLVTDSELNILATGPELIIHQPKSVMDQMNDWCIQHHGESGLTQKVLLSKISLREAEEQTVNFLKKWVEPNTSPICGNSVSQDRRFLYKYMPNLESYFHYRTIDVSTVKELGRRWYDNFYQKSPNKKNNHRALDDILESVNELKFYKDNMFTSSL